ncbi:MAG: phosphoribosylformylglycinamidine synthase subunit PurQ [Oscillospiraceae bacterium]|nr:phosphoribosylformylglycinamidine synthase subunit PurQ [Oscillospiraceae bacterium]
MPSVQVKAIVPVFPGTNSEYDSCAALDKAGFSSRQVIIRNITPSALSESISELASAIRESKVVFIPGGVSGGDEPEGSAKFISAVFRNPAVTDAVNELLYANDGLMLGICNGFQALVKLGLVPFGEIRDIGEDCPTLTFNNVGRHIAKYVTTTVCNANSPWLLKCELGGEYVLPVSHGEGRFIGSVPPGQIVTRYVDNPNGSENDVEGIISPDGRVFGKMAHTERAGRFVAKNIPGNKGQPIFESAYYYYN